MGAIKGQNLRVSIDGKYLCSATTCSLHISAQLEDSSTKDSTGNWQQQECVGKAWDGSAECLMVMDPTETAACGIDIAALVGEEVDITFDITSGAQNRVLSQGLYQGKAIVNDFNCDAPNKANSKCSIQFTGNGALDRVTSSAE